MGKEEYRAMQGGSPICARPACTGTSPGTCGLGGLSPRAEPVMRPAGAGRVGTDRRLQLSQPRSLAQESLGVNRANTAGSRCGH